MKVGMGGLTLWSFLMASAHGAGFMALPFLLPVQAGALAEGSEHAGHMAHLGHAGHAMVGTGGASLMNAMAVGVHSLAYLLVMAAVAYVVYAKLGLALLRTGWFNLDWLWAGSLLVAGLIVLIQ
jgi:hypothetical protein